MLTKRDYEIFNFIDDFGGITIKQASLLFFKNAKFKEDLARKRLKRLADKGFLNYDDDFISNKRIYYRKKKISSHNLILNDFYANLVYFGANILDFKHELKLSGARADGFCIFEYKGIRKNILLEIDMQHKTNLNKYQESYDKNELQRVYGEFPEVIIITCHTPKSYKNKLCPYIFKFMGYDMRNMMQILMDELL